MKGKLGMNSMETEKIAKPIVKAIVDCTAD